MLAQPLVLPFRTLLRAAFRSEMAEPDSSAPAPHSSAHHSDPSELLSQSTPLLFGDLLLCEGPNSDAPSSNPEMLEDQPGECWQESALDFDASVIVRALQYRVRL